MRVLIFEPDYEGHRLHYVANLIRALAPLAPAGVRPVVALSKDAPASREFQAHLQLLISAADFHYSIDRPRVSPLRWGAHVAGELQRTIRRLRPDHVYVPYADGVSQILGLRRPFSDPFPHDLPVEALLLRGPAFYPGAGRLGRFRHQLFWNAAMRVPWTRMYHLDPLVVMAARKAGGRGRLLHQMPEPTEPMTRIDCRDARRMLGIPEDGRLLGSAGIQDERKGVDRLIRAFVGAATGGQLATTDRLLLVGPQSPVVRELLAGSAADFVRTGRILQEDKYVGVERISVALAASDVVCSVPVRHVGSSSFVARAAQVGRPILSSDFGYGGHVTPAFGLGWTCNLEDHQALIRALGDCLNASQAYVPPPSAERFCRFNTVSNFQATWTQMLRERLGLPQSPELVTLSE